MSDVEVFLDWQHQCRRIGVMRLHTDRATQSVTFEYDPEWVEAREYFSLDPSLPVAPGIFRPPAGSQMFGAFGDSAPDTWGRSLLRRRESRASDREARIPRAPREIDYLLGVADESRLGALRFRREGDEHFQAPKRLHVPGTPALGELLTASERFLRKEETDDDLELIWSHGSALGGARPKSSVLDQHGCLSIAKFPKETDDYSRERWEAIAMDLAAAAGIHTATYGLCENNGRPTFLSRRFDRCGSERVPFISAMSMTQHQDGERGSYLEIADALIEHGASAPADLKELFRRVTFSVLISNTDDHLRNHGFLWLGRRGWSLSPAYDINPTPQDVRPRILATNINFDEGTCSIDLLRSVAEEFSLTQQDAGRLIREVAQITKRWRDAAKRRGARRREIQRMQSAFEHEDLAYALRRNLR